MKQQHLIAFNGTWYHVYTNDRGLWVNRKENGRFRVWEHLAEDAEDDFSVAATEKHLHCVCRSKDALWYFLFDGSIWRKRKISEGEKSQTCHRLTLLTKGNFVHLLYVVQEEKESFLVHQILGDGVAKPVVADSICGTEFCVSPHGNGDFTLLYQNEENICGTKQFRWSQKAFDPFVPLDCGCDLKTPVLLASETELLIAAYAVFDQFVNILFLKKDIETGDCKMSAVHLVSGESEGLSLSGFGAHPTISWCEDGLVMSSYMDQDGHWTPPKKYVRGMERENVLYTVETGREHFTAYGYPMGGSIMLYAAKDLLEHPLLAGPSRKKSTDKTVPPINNAKTDATPDSLFVKRSTCTDNMAALRSMVVAQNDMILEILKKIAYLERQLTPSAEALAEDPDAIDRFTKAE